MNQASSVDDLISRSASVITVSWQEIHWLKVRVSRAQQQIARSREQARASLNLLRQIDGSGTWSQPEIRQETKHHAN